jgi:adenylate kinase
VPSLASHVYLDVSTLNHIDWIQYGLVHIAVGDLLREQVAAQSEAGIKAKAFMDSGNLVPDEVVVDMVVDRLSQKDVATAGWLLDGYPRSASQAEAINKQDIRPDVFLLINVPDDEIVNRVIGRRLDPETGAIYHLQYKPPPAGIVARLTQVGP